MADVIPLRRNQDDDALELALVGAVLELPDRLEIIETSGLTGETFRNGRAAQAWRLIRRMAEMRIPEITPSTVCSMGVRRNLLAPGDLQWLKDLAASNMETKDSALQIAEDLRVKMREREVRAALQEQIDLIDRGRFHPGLASGALESVLHGLAVDFSGDEHADQDLLELNVQWDHNVKTDQTMLRPTGIRVLDQILGGGVPRNLWIIQGKPGAGKNALLATMIRARLIADPTCKIGLFGLESGTGWLVRRWQAEDLGIPLAEVGSRKLTPEQWEDKTARVDPFHDRLAKRVVVYRHGGAPAPELVRRAKRMIFKLGVTDLLIDNLREVKPDPRSRQEYHLQVADTIDRFRNLYRYGVSTGLLVHDMEPPREVKPGDERPPHPDNMQGGKDPGARARMVLGIYRHGNAYRATVTKNENGPARWPNGPTCEFKFNYESATIEPEAGRVVDVDEEKKKRNRDAADDAIETSVENTLRRKMLLEKRKADALKVEPVAAPPQTELALMPAGETKK